MVMEKVHEGLEDKGFFERPEGITSVQVCHLHGGHAVGQSAHGQGAQGQVTGVQVKAQRHDGGR